MKKSQPSPADFIDRALRLTGLDLAGLAAELGLREATLYKARGGHIPLSSRARRALELLLAGRAPAAGALRSAASGRSADAEVAALSERLHFLRRHATADEWRILSETVEAFHRRAAARK
ncbi:MAG: hypothetical protein PW734_06205 [Verrucomicrobium sp.]|nr:hypothetical protein [Verrucomicrobium sp.]